MTIADRRDAGFTLVELLVALGLLGFVATLLVAGLSAVTSLAAPGRAAASGQEEVATAQQILRARLERLTPVARTDSADPIVDAQGSPQSFSFFAPPLAQAAPDALHRYRLILTPSGDLVLYTANSLNDVIDLRDPSLKGWVPKRLLSGVASVELRYLGPDRLTDTVRWQEFWGDRKQAPALIRIRAAFPPGDRRVWNDLTVRPRATVNLACRINRTNGRCDAQ